MATVAAARRPQSLHRAKSEGLNTLSDPRSPSPASTYSGGSSPGSIEHHPDLSNEVAALSNKLINAINIQTTLDDALQESRHELDNARERIAQLERSARDHEDLLRQGLLVRKHEVERQEGRWRDELTQERQKRLLAEKDKKRMESELETLTASLFEEANTMVADARKETESSNQKILQLQSQLRENETLLSSHQEQLQDLKAVMQQMSDRDESETSPHQSSAPSTPGLSQGKMSRVLDVANLTPITPSFGDDVQSQPPLFFSQLLTPVLRSDLPAFEDFQTLLRTSKAAASASASNSRASSGNFSGLNAMAIGLGSSVNLMHSHSFTSPAVATPPLTPNMPASAGSASAGSPRDSLNLSAQILPPLKESKYFKRCLPEDIEPTLRLDIAPGLSWLNKRSVLQGIIAGSLAIEPLPPPVSRNYGPIFACSLCGENGKAEKYQRKHQFRISEDGEGDGTSGGGAKTKAQRWPLCDWCLHRVRATCDFIGFLKLCQAGLWRADTPEKAKEAWEEGVRLRERMFWSRVGGGVVPSFVVKSPTDEVTRRLSDESKRSIKEEDPFKSKDSDKRISIGNTVVERPQQVARKDSLADETSSVEEKSVERKDSVADETSQHAERKDSLTDEGSQPTERKDSLADETSSVESTKVEEQVAQQFKSEMNIRDDAEPAIASNDGANALRPTSKDAQEQSKSLSITIPGSFES